MRGMGGYRRTPSWSSAPFRGRGRVVISEGEGALTVRVGGRRIGGADIAMRSGRLPAMQKVLIVTGDAAEDLEVMYPYQRLLEEGYEVHIAAPTAKKLQFVVHDFVEGFDTYTEKPGHCWSADVAF